MAEAFDDYLGLGVAPLGARTLVFRGRSGSGKSCYIRWLRQHHPDCADAAVIDELLCWRDLTRLLRAFPATATPVLIASHLPAAAHLLLRPCGTLRVYRLDGLRGKLPAWLAARGLHASPSTLAEFHARYGANYTDAEIVLERYPGASFDAAWALFRRECRIRHEPAPLLSAGTPGCR